MIATLTRGETLSAEGLVAPVAGEIRGIAAQAEAGRRLPDELIAKLRAAGLFSIYTPNEFGGLDLPLPEALRVVEEVSRHDGSTGWTVALGVANSLFTSVLSEPGAARVLGGWAFNSGAPNATWIGSPAPIFDGDAPRLGESGPEMAFCFLSPSDVQIIDTWYVTGLRATGTQDLYVDNVFVPDEMTGFFAMPHGPRPVREHVLNRIPFVSLFGMVQAPPVCLGLGRRAIEEFQQLARTKENLFGQRLSEQVQANVGLARAEALVRSARTYWYDNVESIWNAAVHGCEISLEDRAQARIALLTAVEHCVSAADLLYRLAGSSAIFQSSPLERCWRDVHTAAQHLQVQDARWETAGRVLMGLDPGSPLL